MPDDDTQDPWDSRRPDVHSAIRGHRCIHDPSAAAALAFGIIASLSFTLKANAQSASGLISTWGKACRMRVAEQFDMPMCDALVNIAATEKQSIDDGTMTPKDIKKSGMSYNWQFRGKNVSGYCNVNGKGKITEFKQGV
jgi:hypothetical protein